MNAGIKLISVLPRDSFGAVFHSGSQSRADPRLSPDWTRANKRNVATTQQERKKKNENDEDAALEH